jgi:hypothetical protein
MFMGLREVYHILGAWQGPKNNLRILRKWLASAVPCGTLRVEVSNRKMTIKKAIDRSGLSQSEVARRMSLPHPTICRWYNGKRTTLRARDAIRLAEVLGRSVEELEV